MTPLTGIRVLITRPRGSGDDLREALEGRGVIVVEVPALEIQPPDDLSPLDSALAQLDHYHWIAFTSRNAVDFFLTRAEERRVAMPAPLRVAALGPSTAGFLGQRGMSVNCMPEEATAASLAREMARAGVAGCRVLIPCGDRSRPDLPDALRAAGAEVTAIVAYRTAAVETDDRKKLAAALTGGQVDVVALASPSALEGIDAVLEGNLQPLRDVRLVCIGPTTAEAVRSAGLVPAATANPHTAAGLAAAIAGLFTE